MRIFELVLASCSLGISSASYHHCTGTSHDDYFDTQRSESIATRRVAVIGAGAGGASTAYYLSQFAAARGITVNITVFERSSYIGGRSTTVNAYNDPEQSVELGASIFVEVNSILMDAVRRFNLPTEGFIEARGGSETTPKLGVWNGKEFVLMQPAESGWWDTAKLFWRYGLAPVRTMRLMKSTVASFLQLYDEPLFPWSSLTEVAQVVGLSPDVTGLTGEQFLKKNSIGDLFAKEVIQASTRVNYASNLGLIHGLEAMVCMATDGAMAVRKGNWQIFASMLNATKNAQVQLNTTVTSLKLQNDGSYFVKTSPTEAEVNTAGEGERFDTVVLAGPYQFAGLDISPPPLHVPDKIPYVELHVTMLASPHLLSPTTFNLPPDSEAPVVVLTTLPPGEEHGGNPDGVGSPGFFSISTVRNTWNPATGRREYVYKIFSPSPATNDFIAKHWDISITSSGEIDETDVSWIHRKVWNSYPYEYPRVTFDELRLDKDLWYTSPIESFISTMETSALSGKNVAKLIVDDWTSVSRETAVYPNLGEQKPLKAKL